MAKIFGYCARYLLNLCLMTAAIIMIACTVLVVFLIAKGGIRISRVEESEEKRSDK